MGLCVAKWGGDAPYGSKNNTSPFRFSIRTFSENFSSNGPKLPKPFNIQKWDWGWPKGGLMFPWLQHCCILSFFITHILWKFQPWAKLPNCQSPSISNNVTGFEPNCQSPSISNNVTGLMPPWLQNCYIHLIFQYAHPLKFSAQMDQNCQSPLMSKNGTGCG